MHGFIENVNVIESLAANSFKSLFEQFVLSAQCVFRHDTIPCRVSRDAGFKRQVEDNRCGVELIPPGNLLKRPSILALEVSCISYGQATEIEPLFDDEVHKVESVTRYGLIGRIVRDKRAAFI